jgi:hypothetical protein
VLFYDFVTAAAKVVLVDPALAETIGKQMDANASREPCEAGSSQQDLCNVRAEAA